jgi:hypothetical protein
LDETPAAAAQGTLLSRLASQVLNRAMPEKLDKERKTMSGRVFKR